MKLTTPPRLRLLAPDLVSSPSPPGMRAPKQRLQPDFVSSSSPPGERAPKQRHHRDFVSSPSPPGKRAPKERLRPGLVSSPSPPRNQTVEKRYEQDIWTEVAKYLQGTDLVRLALTCHWFHHLLFFDDDSIWCYAFLRDLSLRTDDPRLFKFTLARPSQPSWRYLYAAAFNNSHTYSFRQPEKHIEWFRIAGFLVDTSKLLMTAKSVLPPVDDGVEISIELNGACLLSNVCPGIWIADINMVRCPPCNIDGCKVDFVFKGRCRFLMHDIVSCTLRASSGMGLGSTRTLAPTPVMCLRMPPPLPSPTTVTSMHNTSPTFSMSSLGCEHAPTCFPGHASPRALSPSAAT